MLCSIPGWASGVCRFARWSSKRGTTNNPPLLPFAIPCLLPRRASPRREVRRPGRTGTKSDTLFCFFRGISFCVHCVCLVPMALRPAAANNRSRRRPVRKKSDRREVRDYPQLSRPVGGPGYCLPKMEGTSHGRRTTGVRDWICLA